MVQGSVGELVVSHAVLIYSCLLLVYSGLITLRLDNDRMCCAEFLFRLEWSHWGPNMQVDDLLLRLHLYCTVRWPIMLADRGYEWDRRSV